MIPEESFLTAWTELRNTVRELNEYNQEKKDVVDLTNFLMGYIDGLYAKYLEMPKLKEEGEVLPKVERGAEIWRENVNRDAVWLRVADLFIGHGETEHNKIVKAALERIAEVPKAEVAYEDVVEYCKKRCLTVITNELYEELKRR